MASRLVEVESGGREELSGLRGEGRGKGEEEPVRSEGERGAQMHSERGGGRSRRAWKQVGGGHIMLFT